ncbi:DNA/RNA non-specific endonuclease [Actinomadura sp. NPDC047616]|uniref:DNA/RNA non-specific endonuclease n=1 Tax=Actinomadura sp. NPDC047616 TaxID=3155914 RepID=UPI0033CE1CDA
MAATSGYGGGHLIAATLHGVDRRYGLVPQWHSINRGIYMRWEEGASRCLRGPGGRVRRYAVRVEYPAGDSVVHDRFVTRMTVAPGHERQSFGLDIPNRALTGGVPRASQPPGRQPACRRLRRGRGEARPPPTGCRSWHCLRTAWQEHLVVPRAPSRVHGRE